MKKRGPWLLVLLMAGTVIALLVVLLLTGGDDDGVDAAALLADAPAAAKAQGTAVVDLAVSVDNDAIDLSVDATGAVDFGSGLGWFTVELPGRSIETRTDGAVLYVLPEGDDTWLAVHADESGSLGGAGTAEVLAFVDLLARDATKVTDRGSEEIDGRPTRHVRATIDVEGVAELTELVPSGSLPLDVWIDGDGLPVRMRMQGSTQGIFLVITVDLSDWGTELGVAIPPEGLVRDVEADELTRILGAPVDGG